MKNSETLRKVFVLILLLKVFTSSEAKEVSCERLNDVLWLGTIGSVKTCLMDTKTSIDDPGATIYSRDNFVNGLSFRHNVKIFYLPDNVAESFPNLEGYTAWYCSVKEISKRNFNGLEKLKYLSLGGNQIEMIANGTFEDLVNLEFLSLCK